MPQRAASEPITIRTARVAEIDAVARAMGRSRNYIVNQAIEQYLEANAWQMVGSQTALRLPVKPGFSALVRCSLSLQPSMAGRVEATCHYRTGARDFEQIANYTALDMSTPNQHG